MKYKFFISFLDRKDVYSNIILDTDDPIFTASRIRSMQKQRSTNTTADCARVLSINQLPSEKE